MSIQTEITRLESAKEALKTAINSKGGSLTSETLDSYAEAINALPSSSEYATKEEAQGYVDLHNQSISAHADLLSSKMNVVSGAKNGNLAQFNGNGTLEDAGFSFSVVDGILNITYEE